MAARISLPDALRRFRRLKWPGGSPPFETLRDLWNIALDLESDWDLRPDGPLLPLVANAENIEAFRRGLGAGPAAAANVAFISAARQALVRATAALLSRAELSEGVEFIIGFRSGELGALQSDGVTVVPETWELPVHVERARDGEIQVADLSKDWTSLSVDERELGKWIESYPLPARDGHHRMRGSQRAVRRFLQRMFLMGALPRDRAEALSEKWGFRRFEDTAETEAADQLAALPRATSRNLNAGGANKPSRDKAIRECAVWLVSDFMSKSPEKPTHTKSELFPRARALFGAALSSNAFDAAWTRAARSRPDLISWSRGGADPSRERRF